MKFPLFVARRYVFAKKSHNAINIIAIISMIAIMLVSASFIIILSVFNGFDDIVSGMYNNFYSDIKISPAKGKVFMPDTMPLKQIEKIDGIALYATTLTDDALAIYDDKQWYVTVRGASENYKDVSKIDSLIYEGEYKLYTHGARAIVGKGVAIYLGIGLKLVDNLQLIVPRKTSHISLDPNKALMQKKIRAIGKFSVQPDIDNRYVIVPLEFAQDLFDYTNEISSIEISLTEHRYEKSVIKQLEKIFGNGFVIQNQQQQNQLFYKTMQTEKWAIFIILSFILVIACFNLIGSITMLILEKKYDIVMLKNLGTSLPQLKQIYFTEGLLISFIGLISGVILGLLICLLQIKFGLLKLQGMFVIEAYPVKIEFADVFLVFTIVLSVGLFSSYYPVMKLLNKIYR